MSEFLTPKNTLWLILLASCSVLLAALGFQHIGGYIPCTLCYYERYTYYLALPLCLLALIAFSKQRPQIGFIVLFVIALLFFANAILGGYHAGAEWKWWPGPDTCAATSSVAGDAGGLLNSLKTIHVIRCDEASLRILGISFAGYNFLLSLALAALAFSSFLQSRR